jgi:hypothetical protein
MEKTEETAGGCKDKEAILKEAILKDLAGITADNPVSLEEAKKERLARQ